MAALRFSSSILHINKLCMIHQNKKKGKEGKIQLTPLETVEAVVMVLYL